MKRFRLIFTLLTCSWLLAACQDVYSGRLILGGDHLLPAGQNWDGVLIILDGDVRLGPGSIQEGPLFMLGGELYVDGDVQGDLNFLGGHLRLGPNARVNGVLNAGSQQVEISSQAVISGGVSVTNGVDLSSAKRSRSNRLIWLLPEALGLSLLASLLVHFWPRPFRSLQRAALHYPLPSAAMGLLVSIVGPSLMVMMAFTILLVPVALLLFILMGACILYGWVAFGLAAGCWISFHLEKPLRPDQAAFLGTLLFVLGAGLLSFVPLVGPLLDLLLGLLSLGAVLLTRFGLREFVPDNLDFVTE